MIRVCLTPKAPITINGAYKLYAGSIVSQDTPSMPYVSLHEFEFPEDTKLPEEFLPEHVSKITYRGRFVSTVLRAPGVYKFKTATGVVESLNIPQGFRIEATDVADAADLYTLMMTGEIYPDTLYNKPQVPPPAVHLRQLLNKVWQVIQRDVRQWCRRRMN